MSGPFDDMGVAQNKCTPKSSILIGFSIINHPFWGIPIFGNTHMFLVPYFLEMDGEKSVFSTATCRRVLN